MTPQQLSLIDHPLQFARALWPGIRFYREQVDILEAIKECPEVVVVAGNQLGKDFVAGFLALSFFVRPQMYFSKEYVREVEARRTVQASATGGLQQHSPHTRRILTTSVSDKHLDVLWGEIGRYLMTSEPSLLVSNGGPLFATTHEVRFSWERYARNAINYLIGKTCGPESIQAMAGHHAAYNLVIMDEVSAIPQEVYDATRGWAKKTFMFGNAERCNSGREHFFYKYVREGDKPILEGLV